jgi:hypothetical protein
MDKKEYKKIMESINERLGRMQNAGGGFTSDILRVQVGNTIVRVVPVSELPVPFVELHFHYRIGRGPTILCPERSSDVMETYECPICTFARAIYEGTEEPTESEKNLYSEIKAKLRVFAPVVVKGEEFDETVNPQVKWWGFSITLYTSILELINDNDYGIIWDSKDGNDITISKTAPTKSNAWGEITIRPKPKKTPLADTDEQMDSIIESVPEITKVFPPMDVKDISERLDEAFSAPESEPEDNKIDSSVVDEEPEKPSKTPNVDDLLNKLTSDEDE